MGKSRGWFQVSKPKDTGVDEAITNQRVYLRDSTHPEYILLIGSTSANPLLQLWGERGACV